MSSAGARSEQRALYSACLQLQADIREAQQRAVLEGVNYMIFFAPANDYYQMYRWSFSVDRTVHFEKGVSYDRSMGLNAVTFDKDKNKLLAFNPRGVCNGGSVYLKAGRFKQRVIVIPVSGRATIEIMIE